MAACHSSLCSGSPFGRPSRRTRSSEPRRRVPKWRGTRASGPDRRRRSRRQSEHPHRRESPSVAATSWSAPDPTEVVDELIATRSYPVPGSHSRRSGMQLRWSHDRALEPHRRQRTRRQRGARRQRSTRRGRLHHRDVPVGRQRAGVVPEGPGRLQGEDRHHRELRVDPHGLRDRAADPDHRRQPAGRLDPAGHRLPPPLRQGRLDQEGRGPRARSRGAARPTTRPASSTSARSTATCTRSWSSSTARARSGIAPTSSPRPASSRPRPGTSSRPRSTSSRTAGSTPLGLGVSPDTWTLTDWFESIYLRQAGAREVRPALRRHAAVDRSVGADRGRHDEGSPQRRLRRRRHHGSPRPRLGRRHRPGLRRRTPRPTSTTRVASSVASPPARSTPPSSLGETIDWTDFPSFGGPDEARDHRWRRHRGVHRRTRASRSSSST